METSALDVTATNDVSGSADVESVVEISARDVAATNASLGKTDCDNWLSALELEPSAVPLSAIIEIVDVVTVTMNDGSVPP